MTMLTNGSGLAGLGDRAGAALDRLNIVMDLILEALDTQVEQICVTDQSPEPGLQKDFPTPGAQRVILNRTPDGREFEATATVEDVVPANVNRLGGTIVNFGEKPIKLLLARASQVGAGTAFIWLAKEGGSWDFRLGNMFWSGSVSTVAIGGVSKLAVTEV